MKQDLRDFTPEELKKLVSSMDEKPHRADQIFSWVMGKGVTSLVEMRNLPKAFIKSLEEKFQINKLDCAERLISKDGTEKYLWRLQDGEFVESVFLKERTRRTLCVSTQVGCRFKCSFCSSGALGFTRNLSVSEIVGQVLEVQRLTKEKITNLVFMGMGEPLDNYDNLVKSIQIINHPKGIALGARKITVSTCGIVPKILKLKDLGLQVELSVSLHAANNVLRNKLVPINRKYPIGALLNACEQYHNQTGRLITLEYTLIEGENDSNTDVIELARIAQQINAKVNLIGCSSSAAHSSKSPNTNAVEYFMERLQKAGVKVTIRRSKGQDIMAACGQLAAKKAS